METEEERRRRRRRRLAEMKRQKRRAEILYKRVIPAAALAVLLVCIVSVGCLVKGRGEKLHKGQALKQEAMIPYRNIVRLSKAVKKDTGHQSELIPMIYEAHSTSETWEFGDNIGCKYGIFVDLEDGTILAQRDAWVRMNPASMTKILTVLVAAEHVKEEQLADMVPITIDITDYCYINECSVTGFSLNETVPVKDLFYGTVLPSGADAALALAIYVAGSHEAFVELMNEKLEELGLSETTHFTNCVGLYDENHYSTAYDMAMILKAAADNEFCRELLSAHTYNTSRTAQHPDGLLISNWFLRRIEDRNTHGEVLCGKTGYVAKAGSCAASLGSDKNGREYICVTAGSSGKWKCIDDQMELYRMNLPE